MVCGKVNYTVLDSLLQPASPAMFSVEDNAIVVDTKDFAEVTVFNLILRGKLENYLDVVLVDVLFTVEIEEANTFSPV